MGIERLAAMFVAARERRRPVLMPYLTAGIPDARHAVDMFRAMADAGADAFEIGIPYSDPLMDGPVIQRAAAAALAAGVDAAAALRIVAGVRAAVDVPLLVMTYVNPVLRTGPSGFARRAADAGADGLIVADLPVDEAGPIQEAVQQAGLGMVLFAAPTTGEARLRLIAAAEPAFVYGVADLGVTGERDEVSARIDELSRRVRSHVAAPLVLGVGISTADQARSAAARADGVIVGSALVRRVLDAPDPAAAAAALRDAVTDLAHAVHGGR